MTKDTSGSAFPCSQECYGGLTKREWYAGMALQGLLGSDVGHGPIYQGSFELLSKASYEYADAMIAQGEKE